MKIWIIFESQSGNTEKIAQVIHSELKHEGALLHNITEIDASILSSNDLVFLGSPVHASGFPKNFKNFLNSIPDNISVKLASFFTYGVPLTNFYAGYERKVKKFAEKNSWNLLGSFKCLGEHRALHLLEKISAEAAELARKESKGHPDENDMVEARKFAREIVEKTI